MRISWFSNAPWSCTGYGAQTKLFVPKLKDLGHEMSISAFYGLEGATLNIGGITVYPRGMHPYGSDVWSVNAAHARADVCISLMDAWVFEPDNNPHNIPWVPWFPIDSEPLAPLIKQKVEKATARIVMSKFGREVMKQAGLECLYVPHGVDTKIFTPYPKQLAREALGLPADKFILGMVAANKGAPSRKAFQQHLDAFKILKKAVPTALLFIHTSLGWMGEGVNLTQYCDAVGLSWGMMGTHDPATKDVMFPEQFQYKIGYPEQFLAQLYSAFDVHVLVSMGEGFGIPILEAQACGCPVVVGDWTSMSELCFSGWTVPKFSAEKLWNTLQTYQYLAHPEAIAEKMLEAYAVREVDAMRTRAREGAMRYDADYVVEKYWKPALEEIENRLKHKDVPNEP